MIKFLLISLLFVVAPLVAYRPLPDVDLGRELLEWQGEPYRLEGRVWVADDALEVRSPFASFDRLKGRLYLGPLLGESAAHGTVQIEMDSLSLEEPRLEGRVSRDLLQVGRYPFATMEIFDIEGVTQALGRKVHSKGVLRGQLELLGRKHWFDIPVQIYPFSDGAFGIESASPLHLDIAGLGLGDSFDAINAHFEKACPRKIKLVFRLELSPWVPGGAMR